MRLVAAEGLDHFSLTMILQIHYLACFFVYFLIYVYYISKNRINNHIGICINTEEDSGDKHMNSHKYVYTDCTSAGSDWNSWILTADQLVLMLRGTLIWWTDGMYYILCVCISRPGGFSLSHSGVPAWFSGDSSAEGHQHHRYPGYHKYTQLHTNTNYHGYHTNTHNYTWINITSTTVPMGTRLYYALLCTTTHNNTLLHTTMHYYTQLHSTTHIYIHGLQ